MWWPLTLTYIFKVIWPWPRKSCPLCSVYSCGWILSIFSTNDHYRYRVCRMLRFFPESGNLNFWQIFLNFLPLILKKNVQFWMDSFHIWYKWSLPWEGVLHVMTFDLDLYLQGHLTLTLKIVSALQRFQFEIDYFHICHKLSLPLEGVSHVKFITKF